MEERWKIPEREMEEREMEERRGRGDIVYVGNAFLVRIIRMCNF